MSALFHKKHSRPSGQTEKLRQFLDGYQAVDIPGREEGLQPLMAEVAKFAGEHDLDIRTYRSDISVGLVVSVEMDCALAGLTHLIGMVDEIFFLPGRRKREVTLLLEYYTKAIYSDGRKIAPKSSIR